MMDAHVHTVRDALAWPRSVALRETLPEPEPLPPAPVVAPAPPAPSLPRLARFAACQRRRNLRDLALAIAVFAAVAVTVAGMF